MSPTPTKPRVGLAWELTSVTGWGVYGTHVLKHMALSERVRPLLLKQPARFHPDVLDDVLFAPYLSEQAQVFAQVKAGGGGPAQLPVPVLKTLLPGFEPMTAGKVFYGKPDVGVIFFENTHITPKQRAASRRFARIIAGSSWNRDVLVANGVHHVDLVLQGIDPVHFHPMPRRDFARGRFVVFSGGKLEARKGQDLVLAAFRRFHARHPDSILVTAWQNAWPQMAGDIVHRGLVRGVPAQRPDGTLDIAAWAVDNGLPPGAVVDVGFVPHRDVPRVLAACDCGVFPSRNESGTNLPAMECMAMGLPVIVSDNTGHRDLIGPSDQPERVVALREQRAVSSPKAGWGTDGWGESSVAELEAALERLYTDRAAARAIGERAAAFMGTLSWEQQVGRLVDVVARL